MPSKGYKLFRTVKSKPGKLFPLYVFADEETPVGIWLEARCGEKDEKGKVKSRLGALAYRPGWHINDKCPYVTHIYSVHNGQRYQKNNTVWCEVEYSDDVCYQKEADEAGRNKEGKIIKRNAYLKHVPENGYYRYKTSPNMYGEWIIAGKMKITRILSDEEIEKLCHEHGLEPLKRYRKEKQEK